VVYAYQWQKRIDGEWVNMAEAKAATLTPSVEGQYRVLVSFNDSKGNAESVTGGELTVAPAGSDNLAPEFLEDYEYSWPENLPQVFVLTVDQLVQGFTDPDGDPLGVANLKATGAAVTPVLVDGNVTAYQFSASGAGARAMEELRQLSRTVLDGGEPVSEVLPHSLAFNLFLHNSPLQDNGYCEEELKMLNETRKIMGTPELRLSATCVRVPVLRAHSEAVNIEFHEPFPVQEARALLAVAPGVELLENFEANRFPMPTDVTGRDPVAVGRIRQDLSDSNALELWLCGDQIRKGAALNAIQIAELLIQGPAAGTGAVLPGGAA
jgi:hypothetical protein